MERLPRELRTVTPFSKTLALVLFFVVPMIGFYLGTQYQVLINDIEKQRADLATKAPAVNHPTPTPSPFPQKLLPQPVKRALQDLTKLLQTPEANITVVSLEEKEWGDTSLGCPKPGKLYAQVITPGYKVVFSYLGKTYDYHTDKRSTYIRCGTAKNTVQSISPDGARKAMIKTTEQGTRSVVIANADGTEERVLVSKEADTDSWQSLLSTNWSSDSKFFYMLVSLPDGGDMYVFKSSGDMFQNGKKYLLLSELGYNQMPIVKTTWVSPTQLAIEGGVPLVVQPKSYKKYTLDLIQKKLQETY